MSLLLFLHLLGYEAYSFFFTLAAASGMFVLLCSVAFLGKALESCFLSKSLEEKHERLEQLSSFFLIVLGTLVLFSYLL